MKILGIDIGGTTIKGGIVDNGKIIKYFKTATNAQGGRDAVMDSVFCVIDALLSYADSNAPIGISSAGDIDGNTGKVLFATNALPNFTGFALADVMREKYGRKVFALNDAFCALVGEMFYGSAQNYKNIVMLTLGTGLGGAVTVNGKLLTGDNFRACRLGHIPYNREERLCPCGNSGCAETFVSAKGLLTTAKNHGLDVTDANLVFSNANRALVATITDEYTTDLARITMGFIHIFAPSVIIIGGGLCMTAEYWWETFTKKCDTTVPIIKAKLGNDAGVIGATVITQKILF